MVYVLDFDGVICDSNLETCTLSYCAYNNSELYSTVINAKDQEYFSEKRKTIRNADFFDIWEERFQENKCRIEWTRRFKTLRKSSLGDDYWLSLFRLYSGTLDFFSQTSIPIYICTSRDFDSVKILLDHFGLKISGLYGTPKMQSVEQILVKESVSPADMIFVDDNIENLEEVALTGVKCYLAKWGYCNINFKYDNLESLIWLLQLYKERK